jgi:hypothetical protein
MPLPRNREPSRGEGSPERVWLTATRKDENLLISLSINSIQEGALCSVSGLPRASPVRAVEKLLAVTSASQAPRPFCCGRGRGEGAGSFYRFDLAE